MFNNWFKFALIIFMLPGCGSTFLNDSNDFEPRSQKGIVGLSTDLKGYQLKQILIFDINTAKTQTIKSFPKKSLVLFTLPAGNYCIAGVTYTSGYQVHETLKLSGFNSSECFNVLASKVTFGTHLRMTKAESIAGRDELLMENNHLLFQLNFKEMYPLLFNKYGADIVKKSF